MVGEQTSSIRYRAVGMARGGMTQGHVANELGVSIRTIGRWVSYDRAGQPLENSIGHGRKNSVSRVAKIIISKFVVKRGQSTRILAWKLTAMGHPASKTTVHDYLTKSMHVFVITFLFRNLNIAKALA